MSAYAPVAPYAERSRHPRALVLIVAGHAALLAGVMTLKMDLPVPFQPKPTVVDLLEETKPPTEILPPPQPRPERDQRIDRIPAIVPTPPLALPDVDPSPLPPPSRDPGPIGFGNSTGTVPTPEPVRIGPRFITPQSQVKPPYPQQKLRMEEEASLRLKLVIDARGRVTSVEPVGSADPAFLEAARRHIVRNWRYRAATEDGKPVASSTVITLRFQID